MIDKLISFLQWIQSSTKLKKTGDLVFSFLFMLVSMSLTYTVLKETVLRSSYCY